MSNIEQRIIENEIEKSLGNDFSIEKAFDILDIVKGKRAQLGEIREWRGGRFRRTANGWERIKEGARGEKKNPDGVEAHRSQKEESPKTPTSVKIDQKKETNKKINEASKRKKKYGDMNVEEAKKELLGKDLTITDIETGKTRTEKITSILEGNVRGHETVMARVEGGGTYPIKHIDTGKEWKAWKLNLNR